eukprot:SAG31_NODE_8738_length_1396_cov_2.022359_2_plen_58_part_01
MRVDLQRPPEMVFGQFVSVTQKQHLRLHMCIGQTQIQLKLAARVIITASVLLLAVVNV